jgi:hypothetical protein
MTVGELLHRMSAQEFSEWWAFYQMEPWGCEVDDFRAGLVAATVANTSRDAKKHKKPFQPSDFMPNYETPPVPEQSPEDHERIMGMWGRVWEEKFDMGGS